jgi:hypothetical protein
MRKQTPKLQLYYFQDGEPTFHTKEQQVVDQVAVAKAVECQWFNARSVEAGPLLLRFNVTDLPCLVLVRNEPGRRTFAVQRTEIVTGTDLKNLTKLTKIVEKLRQC